MNFEAFIKDIEKNRWNIHGVEVYENGELAKRWGDTKKTRYPIYSCTKTILSLGIGIAVDRGLIDINRPITEYLPKQYVEELSEEQADVFRQLSIRRLMCMSVSGFPFRHEGDSYLRYALSTKIENPGERVFDYSNIPAYLVGVALSEAVGGDAWAFLEENLLHPLHIYKAPCQRCPEGRFYGASGIFLTVHELSRLGLLLYNDGVFDGKRIVSSEYLSLMESVQQENREGGYGLFLQLYRDGCRISGKCNQRCFVLKSRNIVITYLSDMPEGGNDVTESVERNLLDMTGQDDGNSAKESGAAPKTPEKTETCPFAKKCGGCDYQGVPYEEQLLKKQATVRKLLGEFCKPENIIGASRPTHYRNKVHGIFGKDKKGKVYTGIYEENSHRIVPITDCGIENEKATAILKTLGELAGSFKLPVYYEDRGTGLLRHALIRVGQGTGEIMVVLVTADPIFPSRNNFVKELRRRHPEITTVVQNINDRDTSMVLGERNIVLYGKGFIEDILCGLRFRISPSAFFQVNSEQTEVLYQKAIEAAGLTGAERVIDAYCGTGTIGMCAASGAKEVIGVELNSEATRDAIQNAKQNGVKNIRFVNEDASDYMIRMAGAGEKADEVIMDPPRSGSTPEFISAVDILKPSRVVYVSCDPESLKRDLMVFKKKGWTAQSIQPVDMFPYTKHVETVVLLTKK